MEKKWIWVIIIIVLGIFLIWKFGYLYSVSNLSENCNKINIIDTQTQNNKIIIKIENIVNEDVDGEIIGKIYEKSTNIKVDDFNEEFSIEENNIKEFNILTNIQLDESKSLKMESRC